MKTSGGFTVEKISTIDRGEYYIVKSPHGSKVTLDPWDTHSNQEIRTRDQLERVLARYGETLPE